MKFVLIFGFLDSFDLIRTFTKEYFKMQISANNLSRLVEIKNIYLLVLYFLLHHNLVLFC